jgi:hypothetical protein
MEPECLKNANWSGPVKMHMGGSLFFDFTTDDNFDDKVEKLITMMKGVAEPADCENVTGRAAGGANKVESSLDGLFLDQKKDAVAKWLGIINMGEYVSRFIRYRYDFMETLVQADEKDVMEMMEDASIDMKKPHRNPFLKAWKTEKAAAEAKAKEVAEAEAKAETQGGVQVDGARLMCSQEPLTIAGCAKIANEEARCFWRKYFHEEESVTWCDMDMWPTP